MILCICIHRVRTKTAQIPWKIRSNSWENFTHYYLFTCCIIVNVIVWEIGRGKQAAGQSRAPGRVMWTKCLPRDTIQPMESTLRNSNEIICKHRNLRLQVPGKVGAECGLIVLSFQSDHWLQRYSCIGNFAYYAYISGTGSAIAKIRKTIFTIYKLYILCKFQLCSPYSGFWKLMLEE